MKDYNDDLTLSKEDLQVKIDAISMLLHLENLPEELFTNILKKIDFRKNVFSKEINNIIYIEKTYNSGEFNEKQKEEIKQGLDDGLDVEKVKVYTDFNYEANKMYVIRQAFSKGLTIEDVEYILSLDLSSKQTEMVVEDYLYGMNKKEIELYASSNLKLDDDVVSELRLAVLNRISHDKIAKLINVNFNSDQVRELRKFLEKSYSNEKMFVLLSQPSYSSEKIRIISMFIENEYENKLNLEDSQILNFILEKNFNEEQLKIIYKYYYDKNGSIDFTTINILCKKDLSANILDILLDIADKGYDSYKLSTKINQNESIDYYKDLSIKLKIELKNQIR